MKFSYCYFCPLGSLFLKENVIGYRCSLLALYSLHSYALYCLRIGSCICLINHYVCDLTLLNTSLCLLFFFVKCKFLWITRPSYDNLVFLPKSSSTTSISIVINIQLSHFITFTYFVFKTLEFVFKLLTCKYSCYLNYLVLINTYLTKNTMSLSEHHLNKLVQ